MINFLIHDRDMTIMITSISFNAFNDKYLILTKDIY